MLRSMRVLVFGQAQNPANVPLTDSCSIIAWAGDSMMDRTRSSKNIKSNGLLI